MRIIIAGAGEVGFHLAKLLAQEKQDIILIDLNQEKLDYASKHIDVFTLRGSSTSFNVLREADIQRADLLIAVTSSEETNIATCAIGKKLGAKHTVARIRNTEFLFDRDTLDLKILGVDQLISPESLAADEIKRLIKQSVITDTFEFDEGELNLIGLHLSESSVILGKTISEAAEFNPDLNYLTVAIQRGDRAVIPRGDTRFELNDHVYFIALKNGIQQVNDLSGLQKKEIRNIMIIGGSKIGTRAAKRLSKSYNVKMIEIDKEKCFILADELPNTLVIHGDGRNITLLEEEGIDNMDAFIAVTGSTDINILSSLVAKQHSVHRAIALVENIDYIVLSQSIGIDTMINKKLIAANFIFRYIRKGEVVSLTSLHGVDAEVLELVAREGSKITRKPIRDLKLPKTSLIGGVVREGRGMIPMGDFQVRANDRVVVFSMPDSIKEIERFF